MEDARRKIRPPLRAALFLGLTLSLGLAQAQVSYTYDSLGRLISVTDPSGTTARYQYDAVGNMLSISRYSAGQLAVFDYTPQKGLVGATVTLQGTGFSTTATQNVVKFGGVQATVSSATTTKLVANVPAGAVTGNLTVQVGANTVTAGAFAVLTKLDATLATKAAKPGELLTITATDSTFTDPGLQVRFTGSNPLTPSSITGTELRVQVPNGFSDGPVNLESPTQVFQTTTPLYAMPGGASAASTTVKAVGPGTIDGAVYRATVTDTGGTVLVRIPLTQGNVTLNITPQSPTATGTFSAEVFNPAGQKIKTASINLTSPQGVRLDSADVSSAGTYTLVLQGTQAPSIDLNTVGTTDLTVSATPNTAVGFGPSKAGQYLQFPFIAESGPLQAAFTNVTLNGSASVVSTATSSQPLQAGSTTVSGLASTGASSVTVVPGADSTVSGTLNIRGTLVNSSAIGASPSLFTAAFPEQWYRRKVNTAVGQALGIAISDVNQPGGTGYGSIEAVTPNGTLNSIYNGTFYKTLIVPDPGTGPTQITAKPMSGATSNSFNLHVGPSMPLTVGAAITTMTGNTDANTFAHFNVGATDKVQVVVNGLNVGTGQGKIYVQRPDGYYTYMTVNSGADLIFRADGAVASGLHALTIDPATGGSVSTRLKLMTANPTVADDQLASFSTSTANDTVVHNFTGAAASPRYLLVQGLTYSGASGDGKLSVFMPNGYSTSISLPTGSNRMFPNLNQDGLHSIMVVPPSGGTVAGNIIESPGQNLAKAAVTPISLAAGQGKVFTFAGDTATSPNVTLSGLSPAPTAAQPVKVVIFRPDGNPVATATLTSATGTLSVPAITSTTAGTYVVGVFPPGGQSLAFNVVQDTAAPIPTLADDQLVSFSTTTANEAFTRNFTGTSTPRYLLVQGLAYTGATGNGTLALLQPNNFTTSIALPNGSNWMFGNLSQSGTYNVKLTPPSGGKVAGKVMESTGTPLTKNVQATLSASAGQGKVLTFAGTAGTTPKLTFSTLSPVPSTSAPVNVVVFRPDGNRVASATYTSGTYAAITLPAVTATTAGTYIVGVFPSNGQALSFKVTQN